jgi:hypothetical protein
MAVGVGLDHGISLAACGVLSGGKIVVLDGGKVDLYAYGASHVRGISAIGSVL